jgi:calcyclin binding protein
MSSTSLEQEIAEAENLLNTATFPGMKASIQAHLFKLKKQLEQFKASSSTEAHEKASGNETASVSAPSSSGVKPVIVAGNYIPLENFAWDQGSYNSPTVTVYAELDEVGSVKDQVQVSFDQHGFDLRVMGLNGKNYRLVKDNLEKDIIPSESTYVVKKNKVVIKLKKVKGEYSYDHWTSLTAKKKREETEAGKKDPMGGIMDMMKNMYDEGDENMKKIIGEAMLKSRSGEKPSMPSDL